MRPEPPFLTFFSFLGKLFSDLWQKTRESIPGLSSRHRWRVQKAPVADSQAQLTFSAVRHAPPSMHKLRWWPLRLTVGTMSFSIASKTARTCSAEACKAASVTLAAPGSCSSDGASPRKITGLASMARSLMTWTLCQVSKVPRNKVRWLIKLRLLRCRRESSWRWRRGLLRSTLAT